MMSLKYILICIGLLFLLPENKEEDFNILLKINNTHFSEFDDIIVAIELIEKDTSSNMIFNLKGIEDYNIQLQVKKNGVEKMYELNYWDFSFSKGKRDIESMKDEFGRLRYEGVFEEEEIKNINLEKLLETLKPGFYEIRLVLSGKQVASKESTAKIHQSNWITFEIYSFSDCVKRKIDAGIKYDSLEQVLIMTNDTQTGLRNERALKLRYSIKNISLDTLVLKKSSRSYKQAYYYYLNNDCEWDKNAFVSFGCISGDYRTNEYIFPDSTIVLNERVSNKQGVYILQNVLYSIDNNDTFNIQSSPIIVSGYSIRNEY